MATNPVMELPRLRQVWLRGETFYGLGEDGRLWVLYEDGPYPCAWERVTTDAYILHDDGVDD